MIRPSFAHAWQAFSAVNMSVRDVGKKLGGHVQSNNAANIFTNACPIRMSHVLNHVGIKLQRNHGYAVVSGGDLYMYRVNDMMSYLARTFGTPDKTAKMPKPTDFSGMKGIVVVKGHGWSDAAGHVTLWNGQDCSDTCHLTADPDNGTFTPDVASLWALA
jgi:hypothetical protein